MKQINFATTNMGKASSLKRELAPFGIEVIQHPISIDEPRIDDVKEIARYKTIKAYEKIQSPLIANDSGFYIGSLNGFPRAFVNFALETVDLEGIIDMIKTRERKAEFRNCTAYYDGREFKFFESANKGIVIDEKRGTLKPYHWSRLSLIFIPEGETKTLAEMTHEEYDSWRQKRKPHSSNTKFGEWYSSI